MFVLKVLIKYACALFLDKNTLKNPYSFPPFSVSQKLANPFLLSLSLMTKFDEEALSHTTDLLSGTLSLL